MCLDTAWMETSYGSASSPTVASPTARRATMSRLVGSARAENTRDSWSSATRSSLFNQEGEHNLRHCIGLFNHLVDHEGPRPNLGYLAAFGVVDSSFDA